MSDILVQNNVIDIGPAQAFMDFAKTKADGIDYAIIKVGEARTVRNIHYVDQWNKCIASGITPATYFYAYFNDVPNAIAEAKRFVAMAEPKQGDLLMWDWEKPTNPDTLIAAIKTVYDLTGQYMLIYAGNESMIELKNVHDPILSNCKVLGARYSLNEKQIHQGIIPSLETLADPAHPCFCAPVFGKLTGWQYTESAVIGGVPCDRDCFYLSEDDLAILFGLDVKEERAELPDDVEETTVQVDPEPKPAIENADQVLGGVDGPHKPE